MSSTRIRIARPVVLHLLTACVVLLALAALSLSWQTSIAAATTSTPSAVAQTAAHSDINTPAAGNTITVNSLVDVANSSDGLCTLREAITAANTNVESGVTPGECGPGSSSDADTISLTGVTGTIGLVIALPTITSGMTFSGPGLSQLTISGSNSFRVFNLTLSSPGIVTFSGLTIANGRANMDVGAGIYNQNTATVNVDACTFSSNVAALGGAIANSSSGVFTLTNSTLINNFASTAGAVYNGTAGVFNLISSTVQNNGTNGQGSGNGGGILTGSGTLNVINSTISNNIASAGAGIYSGATDGFINITNSTIANNSAAGGFGGGINNGNGSTVQVLNSIVALNGGSFGPDLRGAFISQGHNLIGNNDFSSGFIGGTSNANGDLVGIPSVPLDPLIGPLQINGGATRTRALLPASRAIDAGDTCVVQPSGGGGCLATPLTTDQRAVTRQLGTAVDIGAFESRGFTFSATSGTPQSARVNTAFAPLVVSVSSAAGDPVAGGLVTFTAPTSGPSATFVGGVSTFNFTLNPSGQTNLSPIANGIAGGPYTITAVVNGLPGSALFSLTNLQAPTNTVLSSSANPSDLMQSVTITATITSTGTPTGSVQFKIDGSNSGTAVTLSGGVATLTTSSLTVGTHTVSADYSGEANYLASSGTLSGGQIVRPPPSISISDVSLTEGDGGTATMNFPVTLSAPSNFTVQVNFVTENGTATSPSDYQAANSTLTFTPGQTSRNIGITVNGDTNFESNETLIVTLSNPTNATINASQAQGTILNDDAQGGFIRFSQSIYTVSESAGQLAVIVNRNNDTSQAVMVNYATNDSGAPGSCPLVNTRASARCDFTAAQGTLRFAANETQKSFTVLVNRDSYAEGIESFTVLLSNPTGGAVLATPSAATVRIADSATGPPANLIDDSTVFVRQHYHDFLNREPDAAGLQFWVDQIEGCGADAACRELKRINVSAAFFLSIEFQETGYLAYRMYNAAYGESTSPNVSGTVPIIRLQDFLPDSQQISQGVQVGIGNWQQQLEDNKVAYALDFVQRSRFITAFPLTLTADQFVAKLDQNTSGVLSSDEKAQLVALLGTTPADAQKRSIVARTVAEDGDLRQREINRAFVLMQYYGYLRRNPDDPQDTDFRGWKFWLDKLNQFNGNFVDADMVKSFLVSSEYRQRFGTQ